LKQNSIKANIPTPQNNRPLKHAMGPKLWDTTLIIKYFWKYKHHNHLCNNSVQNWSIRILHRDLGVQI